MKITCFVLLVFIFFCLIWGDACADTVYLPVLLGGPNYDCWDETFTEVGKQAPILSWTNISGKVIVTGLHSMCLTQFTQPYEDATIAIWLTTWADLSTPVIEVATLEQRKYDNEYVDLTNTLPRNLCDHHAQVVVFYDVEWDYVIAQAYF